MIRSKKELNYYLKCDRTALKIPKNRIIPLPFFDSIWKYQILLRKWEFYSNNHSKVFNLIGVFYRIRCQSLGRKLGFSIPRNVFGPGLSIAHYGTIVVHSNAKIGANCRIQEGVTIGATNGEDEAAKIGDNCFIGSGAKIIGNVRIGDNIAIGANAVVVKSFPDGNCSLGGVPAVIISKHGSGANVIRATDIVS